jgi:hypothetical protein
MQSVNAKLFAAGLLFVFLVVALVRPTSAQSQWREDKLPDTSDGLQLSVSLDQPTYQLDDVATVTIKLTNVSQEPITIYNNCPLDIGTGTTNTPHIRMRSGGPSSGSKATLSTIA